MDSLIWPAIPGDRVTDSSVSARGGDHPRAASARQLWGIAAAAGVAQGRVRHVATPAEAAGVESDEVAVCRALTPAIAAHLERAAAVVAAAGSATCTGATLLREYRVPAVVFPDAWDSLRSGQWVVVDGERGTVWIGARLAEIGESSK